LRARRHPEEYVEMMLVTVGSWKSVAARGLAAVALEHQLEDTFGPLRHAAAR
jgi:hypothetical protein